jgi:hypothetical protein
MNYSWINKALIIIEGIIEGIILFYIFILKNIFKFNYHSWFDQITEVFEVQMNFERFESNFELI